MKKHTIVFITLIILLLVGGFFYQNKNVSIEKEAVQQQGIEITKAGLFIEKAGILKFGIDENPLSGVRFSLKTNNDTFEGMSQYDSYDSYYYFDEVAGGSEYYEDAYNTLTQAQKDYVNSIDDFQDIMNFYGNNKPSCDSSSILGIIYNQETNSQPLNALAVDAGQPISDIAELNSTYCVVYLPTYLTLEETKVPNGYVKEKYLVPGIIMVEYNGGPSSASLPTGRSTSPNTEEIPEVGVFDMDYSDYPVELTGIGIVAYPSDYYIQYGNVDRNELIGLDLEAAARVWQRKADMACDFGQRNTATLPRTKATYPDGTPYISNMNSNLFSVFANGGHMCIENQKGTVSVEANAYVNNVESLTTSVNQTLEYKVVVTNTGTVDALDNVIRYTLPDGFIYVDGSASDGGVYKDGYVEWNVERLEEGKKKELTYKAFASKVVVAGQDYIGNASVETFGLNEKVESNKTMVRLSLQNPYTAGPIKIVLMILGLSAGVVIFLTHQYQQQKQQTQE